MTILTVVTPRAAPPATRPGRAPEESFQKEEFEEEELLLLAMMGITLLLSPLSLLMLASPRVTKGSS